MPVLMTDPASFRPIAPGFQSPKLTWSLPGRQYRRPSETLAGFDCVAAFRFSAKRETKKRLGIRPVLQ